MKKPVTRTPLPNHNLAVPFTEHVAEFRRRLIYILVAVVVGSCISYYFIDYILEFLLKPIATQQLYYSSPLGAVNFTFEICIIVGIIFSSPVWLYQVWSFMQPTVPNEWQRRFWWWMGVSTLLAVIGAAYGYFVSLPATLSISQYFQTEHLAPLLSANEYLSFVSRYILAFAVFFQIPLLVFFASLMGILDGKKLIKHQRHSFVACCVVGAVFTPTPDMINQLLLAGPLFILFELSVVGVLINEKKLKLK